MILLEDTLQQAGKHNIKHDYWDRMGITVCRIRLLFGDYTTWGNPISVDTKANVEEIAGNIGGSDHARFREECKKAKAHGGTLIVLIENRNGYQCIDDVAAWTNPNINKTARSIEGPRLAKAMKTMTDRYGVRFEFCTPEEAGERIIQLLEANNGKT